MRATVTAVALAVVVCGGCARRPAVARVPAAPPTPTPPRHDLYVVVPDPGGRVGSLSLTHGDRVVTLETPYAAALIREPGRLDTGTVTPAEVRAAFGAALEALPPRPASFTLNFLEDSDELTPESRAVLAQVLGEIAGRPVAEASVVGHTDRVGSAAYNDALSLERAKRVREASRRSGSPSPGEANASRWSPPRRSGRSQGTAASRSRSTDVGGVPAHWAAGAGSEEERERGSFSWLRGRPATDMDGRA